MTPRLVGEAWWKGSSGVNFHLRHQKKETTGPGLHVSELCLPFLTSFGCRSGAEGARGWWCCCSCSGGGWDGTSFSDRFIPSFVQSLNLRPAPRPDCACPGEPTAGSAESFWRWVFVGEGPVSARTPLWGRSGEEEEGGARALCGAEPVLPELCVGSAEVFLLRDFF